MNRDKAATKVWSKPEIKRLGVIQDVAGAGQAPGAQGNGAKT
jgi:hypothetical protein